jgi:predicted RNase H-like HicB family nuclease
MPGIALTVLFEEAPEGGYVVTVPSLPEVVTEGDDLDEARAAAEEAIACALLVRRDRGEAWPEDQSMAAPTHPGPNVLAELLRPAVGAI